MIILLSIIKSLFTLAKNLPKNSALSLISFENIVTLTSLSNATWFVIFSNVNSVFADIVCTEDKVIVAVLIAVTVTSSDVIPAPLTNIPISINVFSPVKTTVAELSTLTSLTNCFVVEVTSLNTSLSCGSIGSSSITSYTFSLLEPPDFIVYLLLFFWSEKTPSTFVVISIWFLDLKAEAKSGFSWGLGPENLKNTLPTVGAFPFILQDALPAAIVSVDMNLGASFEISNTLYLASSITTSLLSCFFFNNKKVSSEILFLSAEGNDNQILPSWAK